MSTQAFRGALRKILHPRNSNTVNSSPDFPVCPGEDALHSQDFDVVRVHRLRDSARTEKEPQNSCQGRSQNSLDELDTALCMDIRQAESGGIWFTRLSKRPIKNQGPSYRPPDVKRAYVLNAQVSAIFRSTS